MTLETSKDEYNMRSQSSLNFKRRKEGHHLIPEPTNLKPLSSCYTRDLGVKEKKKFRIRESLWSGFEIPLCLQHLLLGRSIDPTSKGRPRWSTRRLSYRKTHRRNINPFLPLSKQVGGKPLKTPTAEDVSPSRSKGHHEGLLVQKSSKSTTLWGVNRHRKETERTKKYLLVSLVSLGEDTGDCTIPLDLPWRSD